MQLFNLKDFFTVCFDYLSTLFVPSIIIMFTDMKILIIYFYKPRAVNLHLICSIFNITYGIENSRSSLRYTSESIKDNYAWT